MKTIKNESDLPTPPREFATGQQFLRSKVDPTALIEHESGECFKRADGQNWKHPAYKRSRKIELIDGVRVAQPWGTLRPATAYCDEKIYQYAPKVKVAA